MLMINVIRAGYNIRVLGFVSRAKDQDIRNHCQNMDWPFEHLWKQGPFWIWRMGDGHSWDLLNFYLDLWHKEQLCISTWINCGADVEVSRLIYVKQKKHSVNDHYSHHHNHWMMQNHGHHPSSYANIIITTTTLQMQIYIL